MCLNIMGEPVKKVAEDNITVYKVLRKSPSYSVTTYSSPYQWTPYEFGTVMAATITLKPHNPKRRDAYESVGLTFPDHRIEEGLHTFADLETAQEVANIRPNYVVCEAYIPVGSEYYEGEWLFRPRDTIEIKSLKSIASSELVVVKEHI